MRMAENSREEAVAMQGRGQRANPLAEIAAYATPQSAR
jgi:hypothetical protein